MGRKITYIKEITKEYFRKLSYTSIMTESIMVEDEFLDIIQDGLQDKIKIGTEIILENPVGSKTIWVVAGVNHDSTNGTVDLISKYLVQANDKYDYSGVYGNTNIYKFSDLRSWLNDTYIKGFSKEIQNNLKPIETVTDSNGELFTTIDKVKIPSMTEVGIGTNNISFIPENKEGEKYPLFDKGTSKTTNKKRIKHEKDKDNPHWWWTRTRYNVNQNMVCVVSSIGGCTGRDSWTHSNGGIIPIIRF